MFDYTVTREGKAYTEFREFTDNRRARLAQETTSIAGSVSTAPSGSNKEQYLKNKQDAAEARKKANKIKRLTAEMESLEAELASVEEQMNGEAATDYKKVAELDLRKTEIEDRLMEIYEELG